MPLCCLKCGWIPGLRHNWQVYIYIYTTYRLPTGTLTVYRALKLIRAGCGTRFRGMRSLTFAACGNKTLFSIIFTTSPLAKSWIRACIQHNSGGTTKNLPLLNYKFLIITFKKCFLACPNMKAPATYAHFLTFNAANL